MARINPYQPSRSLAEESIVNRLPITPYKLSFAIIMMAICIFFVGRIYVASNGTQPLGYQAFRGWALNAASIALIVLGSTIAIVTLTWRQFRSRLRATA